MFVSRCDCTLILPTRNRRAVLDETLGRIAALPDRRYEVIVLDNGSEDDTPVLRDRHPSVRWIALGRNLGSAARNVGASAARGRVLLMLDDDSWPEPGTIERAVRLMDDRADLGAAACRVRLADPPSRHDAGGVPGVFFNCGGVIRRSAFIEVGGLPIDFQYYVEEYDLCCRLWRAGWRVEPRGDLLVRHRRSTVNRDNDRMIRLLVRNNLKLWAKYAPRPHREDLVESALQRYRRIAGKHGAMAGFRAGLAQGRAETAGAAESRRLLSPAHLQDLFGLSEARTVLTRWAQRFHVRTVAIWRRGKGCEQVLDLARSIGFRIEAVYDEPDAADTDRCWRRAPLRDEACFDTTRVDGIVAGTLSPGVAEDWTAELSARFPRMPIVSAAPWCLDVTAPRAVAV
ncbi:MAG: glycosyltransferase family 2 protein [Phycisphaerae bacterium]